MTRVQTPRFCGAPRSAGVFVLDFGFSRPLRTSWLTVGTLLLESASLPRSAGTDSFFFSIETPAGTSAPADQGRRMVAKAPSPGSHHRLLRRTVPEGGKWAL